jgi:hypothetical protein
MKHYRFAPTDATREINATAFATYPTQKSAKLLDDKKSRQKI